MFTDESTESSGFRPSRGEGGGRSGEGRMTTTRILLGAVLVAAGAGPAAAQYGLPPYSPPGRSAGVGLSGVPIGDPGAGAVPGRPQATEAALPPLRPSG